MLIHPHALPSRLSEAMPGLEMKARALRAVFDVLHLINDALQLLQPVLQPGFFLDKAQNQGNARQVDL